MAVRHKLLRGLGAGKYLGFAIQKLGRLATEARGPGPSRTKRYTVDNGMVDIKVSIQDEQHYVKIKRKTCPPFLSGLCDLVLQPLGGGVFSPVYQVPDPEDATQTIDVFRRFYPAQATPPAVRAWRDEPRLATSAAAAEQLVHLKASMFSGEMRKYVQVLQGQGKEAYYSPSFAVTHGIFKSSTGSRWLISIGGNGVFAWPLSVCRATPVIDAQGTVLLDYTPVQSYPSLVAEVSAVTAAGSVILLLVPSEMAAFYQYAPLFPTCGWAFSETGDRALNTGWTVDGDYIATTLFEVAIMETDGIPRSASLVRREHSRTYVAGDGEGHIKYPVGSELYSFSLRSRTGAAPISFSAPVHAYFSGDVEQIVRLEFATPAASLEDHNDIYPLSGINTCLSDEDFGTTFTDANVTRTNPMWFSYPAGNNKVSLTSNPSAVFETVGSLTYLGQNYAFAGDHIEELWTTTLHNVTKSTDWRYRQILIVPLYEREGFYVASERVDTASIAAETTQSQLLTVREQLEAVREEDCAAVGTKALIHSGGTVGLGGACVRNNVTGDGRYTKNIGVGAFVFPVHRGQPFRVRMFSDCASVLGTPAPFTTVINFGSSEPEIRTFTFEFHGSGGVKRVLPDYPAAVTGAVVGDLFRFMEPGDRQIMVAIRDAFDGGTYIITKEVNKLSGPDLASSAHGYPVAQVGTSWAFIGVP